MNQIAELFPPAGLVLQAGPLVLRGITDDVLVHVLPTAICMDHHATALPGSGANYVAGSVIHHYQGAPPPWPERALVGPPWWIDLLCDLADAVDR